MNNIGIFLNAQPFIALFLVVALGYLVAKINIAGFSLGAGAVLFVGLAVGAIAPKSAPTGLLGTVGLVLFVYGVGIQYGKDFFKGLASPFGIKANILAAVAVLAGSVVAVVSANFLGFGMDFAAGMFSGTMTATAAMQAAMDSAGNPNPATSYAIAYPFGIIGSILCLYVFNLLLRPKIDIPASSRLVVAEARAGDKGLAGQTIAEVLQRVPEDLEVLAFRRAGMNMPLDPSISLEADDVLAIAGLPKAISRLNLGQSEEVRSDRRNLDYVRCFVSKSKFVGAKLSDLQLPKDLAAKIVQVRRGDVDILPSPDLVIEYGDQVGVLVEPAGRDTISEYFGDSVTAQTEFSFISLGLGLVLGGLVGLIPIPIPGVGSITLGMAGGPLVVGLTLGYFGRLGPFNWNLPVVSNVVLRNFGISVFLGVTGLASGAPFVKNIASGLPYFISGVLVLLTVVLTILVIGYYILRINFDDLVGVVSGAVGNPAILGYANQLAPTGKPNIAYAMIFPGVGTVLKVIAAQVIVGLAAGG
jgi:putative transport protein